MELVTNYIPNLPEHLCYERNIPSKPYPLELVVEKKQPKIMIYMGCLKF